MKIVILVRILWASGAQKIAIEEAKVLTKLGHDVRLVFLREGKSGYLLKDSLSQVNYEVFSHDKPKWLYSQITGIFMPDRKGEGTLDYNLLKSFASSLKRSDADLLICHDQWAGMAGLWIKRRIGIPYEVIVHERVTGSYSAPIIGRFARYMEQNVFKHSSKVFGITKKVADSIINVYGISAQPNFPGVDLKSFKEFKEKENLIIASATWDKDRDPKIYLRILQKLDNFNLKIVGRYRTENQFLEVSEFVRAHKLTDRVEIITAIGESDLQQLYDNAKFSIRFGNGNNEYGLGTSNVEAISHLTPVIINQLGISDIITERGGGFVANTTNPNSVDIDEVTKFIREYNTEDKYAILQNQLRSIVMEYTWTKHAEKLLDCIKEA